MVSFSSFQYVFPASDASWKIPLIVKYFHGANAVCWRGDKGFRCTVSEEAMERLLLEPVDETIQVEMNQIWSGHSCSNALSLLEPRLFEDELRQPLSETEQESVRHIQKAVHLRLKTRGELFFRKQLQIPLGALRACFAHCKFDESHIVRYVSTNDGQHIVLWLKNGLGMILTCQEISDFTLPVFDLDEGFCEDFPRYPQLLSDWNDCFGVWKAKLQETNGNSWNDPVL